MENQIMDHTFKNTEENLKIYSSIADVQRYANLVKRIKGAVGSSIRLEITKETRFLATAAYKSRTNYVKVPESVRRDIHKAILKKMTYGDWTDFVFTTDRTAKGKLTMVLSSEEEVLYGKAVQSMARAISGTFNLYGSLSIGTDIFLDLDSLRSNFIDFLFGSGGPIVTYSYQLNSVLKRADSVIVNGEIESTRAIKITFDSFNASIDRIREIKENVTEETWQVIERGISKSIDAEARCIIDHIVTGKEINIINGEPSVE